LAFPTNLWSINPFNTNGNIVTKEVIGPAIVKGRAWKVYAAGVGVVAGNDGDVGNGGGWATEKRENRRVKASRAIP